MVTVISLGGSIVAPDAVDVPFLRSFRQEVETILDEDGSRGLVLVVGGGGVARSYQRAYREIAETPDPELQDWIGVAATRLNASLLKGIFRDRCRDEIVTDPTSASGMSGRVLIAAGWKPGFSSDYDAVLLALGLGADTVINLSNIEQVYTADPKKDPAARPIDQVSWKDFQDLVGHEWSPGSNLPFDPIATREAAEHHLKVIVAAGRDLPNLRKILAGEPFHGTIIGPD